MLAHSLYRISFPLCDATAWLSAFQAVFTSCAGPSFEDLMCNEPAKIALQLKDPNGQVRALYGAHGHIILVELVSATQGRTFALVQDDEGSRNAASINFGSEGSRNAASLLLAMSPTPSVGTYYWWADPADAEYGALPIGRATPPAHI